MGSLLNLGAWLCLASLLVACSSSGETYDPDRRGVYVVHLDTAGYTLIRDGQPFAIRGAGGHQRMALLREYGGNTVRVYKPDSLGAVLDRAEQLGLAVIADLPLPYSRRANDIAAREIRQMTPELLQIVERYHKHPALLYWIVGNEVFNRGYSSEFVDAYNELAAEIRRIDPDHPISSTFNVHQLGYTKIRFSQPDLDFISFNLFGNLRSLEDDLSQLYAIWRGPFVLTEWSYSGPWETQQTEWAAPLEPPNYTKAEHLTERYREWVTPLYGTGRLMGDLAFYWGSKFEVTPTWYSFFTPAGHQSEMTHALGDIWAGTERAFPGPSVEYLLLNGQGEQDNVLLTAGTEAGAEVTFRNPAGTDHRTYWEIRPEAWQSSDVEMAPLPDLFVEKSASRARFRIPTTPGPYRLYYRVETPDGYFSADNLPFYVLNPDDAK